MNKLNNEVHYFEEGDVLEVKNIIEFDKVYQVLDIFIVNSNNIEFANTNYNNFKLFNP